MATAMEGNTEGTWPGMGHTGIKTVRTHTQITAISIRMTTPMRTTEASSLATRDVTEVAWEIPTATASSASPMPARISTAHVCAISASAGMIAQKDLTSVT
jgi:hypothetical protein